MRVYLADERLSQRAASLAIVAALHILFIAILVSQSATIRSLLPSLNPARLLPDTAPKPPPPPPVSPALLPPPPLLPVPLPEIRVAPPPDQSRAPRAITHETRAAPAPPTSHFGPAGGDAGLGIDAPTSAGGGGQSRGTLADFDAAVKRRILARKRQPSLAADLRNTCVINYTVTIDRTGSLAGLSIDPCAIVQINEAARTAIRQAAPFPPPPALGAATYDVHGTLIFHP